MEYIGDTDGTLEFVVLYKEETSVTVPGFGGGGGWVRGCSTNFYATLLNTIFNRNGTPTFLYTFY